MIAHIKGQLLFKSFDYVIIDVNGIGYQVFIPLTTFYQLPDLYQSVSLNTYTYLREDAIQLYGFLTTREKEIFQFLIGVSGVGPRLAINILSGITPDELYRAIVERDVDKLNRIPGVGNKTAQRLLVELGDKIKGIWGEGPVSTPKKADGLFKDVASALINLGYKSSDVEKAVNEIRGEAEECGFEVVFKKALHALSSR